MRGRIVHGEQSMGGGLMPGQHKPLPRPRSMPAGRTDPIRPRSGRYFAAIWPELLTLTLCVRPLLVHWPYQEPSAPMDNADRLLQP